jgi:hypothetical protein
MGKEKGRKLMDLVITELNYHGIPVPPRDPLQADEEPWQIMSDFKEGSGQLDGDISSRKATISLVMTLSELVHPAETWQASSVTCVRRAPAHLSFEVEAGFQESDKQTKLIVTTVQVMATLVATGRDGSLRKIKEITAGKGPNWFLKCVFAIIHAEMNDVVASLLLDIKERINQCLTEDEIASVTNRLVFYTFLPYYEGPTEPPNLLSNVRGMAIGMYMKIDPENPDHSAILYKILQQFFPEAQQNVVARTMLGTHMVMSKTTDGSANIPARGIPANFRDNRYYKIFYKHVDKRISVIMFYVILHCVLHIPRNKILNVYLVHPDINDKSLSKGARNTSAIAVSVADERTLNTLMQGASELAVYLQEFVPDDERENSFQGVTMTTPNYSPESLLRSYDTTRYIPERNRDNCDPPVLTRHTMQVLTEFSRAMHAEGPQWRAPPPPQLPLQISQSRPSSSPHRKRPATEDAHDGSDSDNMEMNMETDTDRHNSSSRSSTGTEKMGASMVRSSNGTNSTRAQQNDLSTTLSDLHDHICSDTSGHNAIRHTFAAIQQAATSTIHQDQLAQQVRQWLASITPPSPVATTGKGDERGSDFGKAGGGDQNK